MVTAMMSGGGGGIWAAAHDAMAMSSVAVSLVVFMVSPLLGLRMMKARGCDGMISCEPIFVKIR
jgi:hypothetical protein